MQSSEDFYVLMSARSRIFNVEYRTSNFRFGTFFFHRSPLWNWTRIWIVANYGLFDSSVLWGFFRIWEIAYHGSRRQAVVTFYCPFNSTLQRSKRKIKWPQKSKVPRDWANVELSLMLCHLSIELFFSRGLLCSLGAMPWAFNF